VFAGFFVTLLDARGEFDFLLRREQFHLADFPQVKPDGGVAVVAGTLVAEGGGVALGRFGRRGIGYDVTLGAASFFRRAGRAVFRRSDLDFLDTATIGWARR
jgi:hypothetical protein